LNGTTDFKPTVAMAFERGALGDMHDEDRATVTRRYRMSSGTRVIYTAPESGSFAAGLIVFPSLRGHTPMFVELCERLAALHGYEIVSPELFADSHLGESERIALCRTMDHARVLDDARLAAKSLRTRPALAMGFCLGGMFACLALDALPLAGVISFYGFIRMPADWERAQRQEPLDVVQRATVPVLAVLGGRDPLIPRGDVDALANSAATVQVFEDAGHAFAHDPSLPLYRLDDARHAWRSAVDFITRVSTPHG
jgi:dienelactone hydrolase